MAPPELREAAAVCKSYGLRVSIQKIGATPRSHDEQDLRDAINLLEKEGWRVAHNPINSGITPGEQPIIELARDVMNDIPTAVFIYASMMMGNAVRMLVELGRPQEEIRTSFEDTLKKFLDQ